MKEPVLILGTAVLAGLITVLGGEAWAAADSCFDCHRVMEGTSRVFTNDIHRAIEISCANCHGGDPAETNQNIAMSASRGFKVRVTRQAIPAFCGNCHSRADYMSQYAPDLRVDQLERYTNGVHGKLLAAGRRRAAECVDCHGIHQIRPAGNPLSMTSPQRVTRTCAKCHEATAKSYADSKHARVFNTARRPGCTVCHSSHDTEPATRAMLTGSTSICAQCHRRGSRSLKLANEMAKVLTDLEAAGPDSKDALDRARIAVHSMNLDALKRAAEPVSPSTNPDEK